MKKIGMMTFPNSTSFGASLQMFALYTTIHKLGYDVEVINYINSHMENRKHVPSASAQTKHTIGTVVNNWLCQNPKQNAFRKFEKQMHFYPNNIIRTSKELSALSDRYSHVIVGSDQVWNPLITNFDTGYLLDFCGKDTKRVAYAPSFGVSSLDDQYREAYIRGLLRFDALSAREIRGQELISELIGEDSQLVLDPSMLMTKNEWMKIIHKCKYSSNGYIVRFLLNKSQQNDRFVEELSKKKGLPVYEIGGNFLTNFRHKNMRYSGVIGPAEWLDIINNANCVVTDSFHGTAFSILFEKELYVSLVSSTNSRLVTLLDNFNLTNRVINSACEEYTDINYDAVEKILGEKREESMAYLRRSLS